MYIISVARDEGKIPEVIKKGDRKRQKKRQKKTCHGGNREQVKEPEQTEVKPRQKHNIPPGKIKIKLEVLKMLFENLTESEVMTARAEVERFKANAIKCAFMVRVYTLREREGGCTNGGETDTIDSFYLFSDKMSRAAVVVYAHDAGFSENEVLHLKRRVIFGNEYLHADVITRPGSWHMAGGNFVYTCDSRYKEVTGGLAYPVQVHDRVEA